MARIPTWDLTKIPQQDEFVNIKVEYPAYFGGLNNGKTFALCIRAWIHSIKYPNNAGVIARATYPELRDTTRKQFFQILGCNETNIRGHPWVDRWNASENYLRLANGSEIYFRHLSDEAALNALLSLNIYWFGIDQAEEVSESAFRTLVGRKGRTKGPPTWGALVGNPAGHDWIWHRFVEDREAALDKGYYMIDATTFDNPFRRDGYVEELLEIGDQNWVKRYVYGNWDAFKGQVYEDFNPQYHVIDPVEIRDNMKLGIGYDRGYNHPTAFVWLARDYNGVYHVYQEHVEREQTPDQHALRVKAKGIKREDGRQLIVYAGHDAINRDPVTGLNMQDAYRQEGINLTVGKRDDPMTGINIVQQLLRVDKTREHPYKPGLMGRPNLVIHSTCEKLQEEFGQYRWRELKPGQERERAQPDEVVKVNDDALDALRYVVMGLSSRIQPISPEDQPDRSNPLFVDMEEVVKRTGRLRDNRSWLYH